MTLQRALVTGGAGFIGSHLCEALLNSEHEVVCMDNFHTSERRNVEHLCTNRRFFLVEHDVTQPVTVVADKIYHLACPASPVHYQRNPVKTIQTAVQGTIHMLTLARRLRVPVLIASTSEVYGEPQCHPQSETYWGYVNPVGPRACYVEGKRCAEALAVSYAAQYSVDIRVARIFNTYGPRMREDDGRVVPNFVLQALRNEPVTINGSGDQTRSFCYVDDLVDGLLRLLNTEGVPGPVNLGNPVECTIRDLAEKVVFLTSSSSKLTFQPLPEDDPTRRCPDITKAQTMLGWMPQTSLGQGLMRTIGYFSHTTEKLSGKLVMDE